MRIPPLQPRPAGSARGVDDVVRSPRRPAPPEDGYCPSELDPDPRASCLIAGATETALGLVRHHHAPTRRSETATVLLHGAAGSWTTWTPALRAARDAGHPLEDVVAVDLPGWGASAGPADDARFTPEAVADAVIRVVDDLGYVGCRIVGHSMGGFLALDLAARHPGRVRSVALVSPTLYSVMRSAAHPILRFGTLPGFSMMLGSIHVTRLLGASGLAFVRMLQRAGLLRQLTRPLFAHGGRVRGSVIAALAVEVRPRGFLRATEIAVAYPAGALWPRIACPVTAVRGRRDVFVTPEDLARLARDVPGASSAVIADAGHFAHVERPTETLRALGLLP
ncbi:MULTISPECIES: alpha/beta hydrolase [Clavibacter]|uniref:Alpha/beta hydrolase n=2 Tax=Clavibacter TaxID=1573 RepID=A0A399NXU7_9MICO|nr:MULTISPECIES: alpha/beta hydrolase [Clavibacter]RII97406.1 alpha/beta hydrolase [Clavibacter michiganensis]UKF23660.1 alpha/beta hydrolase [Clavibacter sp. A6099]